MKVHRLRIIFLGYAVLLVALIPLIADATNRRAEYIYTARYDRCLFNEEVDPTELGRNIAHGHPVTREFGSLLQSFEFQNDYYVIEPLHLAYALHVVGERLGNQESTKQKSWISNAIDADMKDRITSTIYRKYAKDYLRKCFKGKHNTANLGYNGSLTKPGESQSFDLYMFNED